MNRIFLLLLASCLILIGCDTSGSDPDDEPDEPQLVETELMPLDVGNQWIYSAEGENENDTLSIEKDTTVEGSDYLLAVETGELGGTTYLYRYDKTGLEEAFEGGGTKRYFLYPDDREGTSTDDLYTVREGDETTWNGLLVDEDSTVKTPAGEFSALMYRNYQRDNDTEEVTASFEYWFAPGVGIVKIRSAYGFGVRVEVLQSYSLAQ